MRRDERRYEPLHDGGTCDDLDVMVVRGISIPESRPVRVALKALEEDTGGLIVPHSIGEIPLAISGGTLLKSLVTAEKAKRKKEQGLTNKKTIPIRRLDNICRFITGMNEFDDLTLAVADPERPFKINDHGQIIIEFDDSNLQLDEDRDKIFESMEYLLQGSGNISNDVLTEFHPPLIGVGIDVPCMLDVGQSYLDFTSDPNIVIRQRIDHARSLRGELPIEGPIFPETVTFGGLRVVTRKKNPAHMFTLREEIPFDVDAVNEEFKKLRKAS